MNTGGSQIISFAASMAIARLAGPEEFGVFAIAGAMVMIGNIFCEAGFSSTIIYDESFCKEKASTILWLSVFASIIIFFTLWSLAQPLATWFNAPKLQDILPFMAASCIATSFGNTHAALIARNLNFRKKTLLSLSSNVIAVAIGLSAALVGYPLAGLTVIFVLTPFLLTFFMWTLTPWSVRLVCKPSLLVSDIAYAGNITLSSILDQGSKSSITFFLGQRFDVTALGYFSRAEAIKNIAGQAIDKVVQRVAFPVLSRARRSDQENSIEYHLLISEALLLILLPLCWFIQKFSSDIVLLLFGPGWSKSAPLLEILIIWGVCMPLGSLNLTLLKSNGRTLFMLFSKGAVMLSIFSIFLFSRSTDILFILTLLVTVFVLQLLASIVGLASMPSFRLIKYIKRILQTTLVVMAGIMAYELLAIFNINFIFGNLIFNGLAMFALVSLIYFFVFKMSAYDRSLS